MYYTDYSTAKINHNYRQSEFARAAEAGRLADLTRNSSPALPSLARQKLGDELINLGKVLKHNSLPKQASGPDH